MICQNCFRTNTDTNGVLLNNIEVLERLSIGMHFGKALSSFPHNYSQPIVITCNECFQMLTCNEKNSQNAWEFSWCSFLWKFMKSLDTENDLYLMWKLLPVSLRKFWLTSYQSVCRNYDVMISLNSPSSCFADITGKGNHIERLNSSGNLLNLMQSCNENCYCSVICPWGCTEFVDECGYISFNRFLAVKFPHKKMPLSNKSINIKYNNKWNRTDSNIFIGIRPDYLDSSYYFMDNMEWLVQPCIRYLTAKGLFICTCREHDGGSILNYIHPPRNPITSVYPAPNGDQLAHAVLAPRVIKPIKCNKYSDTYQMQDCYGGFKGVDSCDLLEVGNYARTNVLCEKNISLSLHGRPDMRCKLSQLVYDKIVPFQYEQEKLEMMSETLSDDVLLNISHSLSGSTYISFQDALSMLFNEEVMSKFLYRPSWPMSLIQCDIPNIGRGFKPYILPMFRSIYDLRYPWLMLSLITSLPTMWDCINNTVCKNNMDPLWHGFLLDYAANNVLKYHRNKPIKSTKYQVKNPYNNKHLKPVQLSLKMEPTNVTVNNIHENNIDNNYTPKFNYNTFIQMLQTINGVIVHSSLTELQVMIQQHDYVDVDTKFIIIIQELSSEHFLETFQLQDKDNKIMNGSLTYICNITPSDRMLKLNNWKCTGFALGGITNTSYGWKFNRGNEPVYTKRSSIQANMIVYEINCSENEFYHDKSAMKNQYMEYMGCQMNKKCIIHGFPMTSMALGNGYTCSNTLKKKEKRCQKVAFIECPCTICYFKLCRQCSKQEDGNITATLPSCNGMESYVDKNDRKRKFNNDFVILNSISDKRDDMLLFDLDFNESSISESGTANEDEEENKYYIPTTNAAKQVATTVLKERQSRFGLHVLLNEHCTLLVRRGSQLKPSRGAKGFLERIMATTDGQSIPLLFPEAMIFPSIFWKQSGDGSYPGAIPIGLWTGTTEAHSLGFAGIPEHMRCRIKNSSLLCGTDPRYIYFAFDSVYNVMSRGTDNRIVFKRGFEHMLGSYTVTGQSNDSILSSDMIDSRQNVQKLAALVRDREPTYFYTHTCNQQDHFGTAPLRKWLCKKLEELTLNSSLNEVDYEELCNSYHLATAVQMIRTWFKVGKMYMNYIITSQEYPLGKIERHWWRWEYQDAKGNLPHIHCLLWTNESKHNPADLQKLQDRVRCSQKTFFWNKEEIQSLIDEGLLPDSSSDTITDILENANLILTHNCANAKYRCMRRTGIGKEDLKCRFVDHFTENPDPNTYGYKKIDPRHKADTMEILQKLGLYNEEGVEQDYRFVAGKYVYPAEKGELMSPCNPRLFVAHKSSDNLVITDTYFSCRYLAKYVQGIDENCKVQLKAGKGDKKIVMEEQNTTNTKITSGKIFESKRDEKMKKNPSFIGRAIGLPEIVGLLLQEQQVFTTSTFISIPTVPLEQRPAHERGNRSHSSSVDIIGEHSLAGIAVGQGNRNFVCQQIREQLSFPECRQFTNMERMIIQDALSSPLSLDAITIYSCRPPELRFINSPVMYFKYFTRIAHKPTNSITKKTTCESLLHTDVRKSGWVDGLDCQILIKPTAIKLVMNMSSCTKGIQHICNILNYVLYGEIINDSDILESPMALLNYQRTFVDLKYGLYRELPFPLFNVVKPTQSNRFLIHVLLSMGYFDNEGCLFQGQHMKDFFANAQLITSNQNPTEDDVVRIVKNFVLEQLLYIPGGTMMFDRYCIAAYDAIKYALLSDSIICNDVPSYLYTSLVAEANIATTAMLHDNKLSLAKSICQLPNTPKLSEFISATKDNPLVWKPQMHRIKDQSEESFIETNKVCELTTASIDSYTSAPLSNTKSLLICGGPGTGKTFQMQLAAAYALSKGLTTIITAVMAERALYLGGRHLHYLFSIPADNTKNVHKIIDQCIRGLNNNPERLYLLRIADVILIDEMGYMSANLLNVIDTVLRKIRGKSSFMGGVLLIGTIDDQQIPPVRAIPLLVSSLIPTSFIMVLLIHSVRARGDTSLQLLINISRKIRPTPVEIQQFRSIIINECSHVSDWSDKRIQQGTMRILGTKKALLKAEQEYYSNIEKQGLVIVTREAETSQCCIGSHGNWKTADLNISQSLNRFVNEVETLRLHENMIVEMTYNKVNTWSHCQIGILLDLPTTENLNAWKPIKIMLAPVGVNRLPEVVITKDTLAQHGWREIKVGTAPENEVRMYGKITAKRKQYAIKPRIAMTIHKALGGNFGSVATTVNFSNTNSGYRLWQKEQVEVLISRTPTTTDLIFVGDPTETADNLVELLFKISPFSVYMRHIVDRMTSTNPTNFIIEPLEYLPYNVISTVIPSESEYGYVYLLLSLRDHNTTYVGQTNNLKRRVSEHNRGIASKVTTASALRPWYPIAFITGFDAEDEHDRLQIESSWQQVRNRSGKSSQNIIDILHAGKNLVAAKNEYVYKYAKLKLIQCIKFN